MKIDHNTYRRIVENGQQTLLHGHVIMFWNCLNGDLTIDHYHWSIKATCSRIQRFNPYEWKCYRKKGKVIVVTPKGQFVIRGPTRFSKDGSVL